jgi:hypothetical protein
MLSVCIPPGCGDTSILIFGATGQTGKKVLRAALDTGARVTVFVRNEKRIPPELRGKDSKLTVKVGNLTKLKDVTDIVSNAAPSSIIITSALARNESFRPLNTNLVPTIVKALEYNGRLGSTKIVYLSGAFSTEKAKKTDKESAPLSCCLSCCVIPCFGIQAMVRDNNNVGNYLLHDCNPATQFTIVKMGYVSDAKSKGKKLVPVIGGKDPNQKVTFEDMGNLLVEIATANKPELNRQIVFATY